MLGVWRGEAGESLFRQTATAGEQWNKSTVQTMCCHTSQQLKHEKYFDKRRRIAPAIVYLTVSCYSGKQILAH